MTPDLKDITIISFVQDPDSKCSISNVFVDLSCEKVQSILDYIKDKTMPPVRSRSELLELE